MGYYLFDNPPVRSQGRPNRRGHPTNQGTHPMTRLKTAASHIALFAITGIITYLVMAYGPGI